MTALDWLLTLTTLSMRATIFSTLKGSSPSRICGAKILVMLNMMESWLSPMYHIDVSPVSDTPVTPSSVCILTTTASAPVAAPPDMTIGLANFMETGVHFTPVIFIDRPPHLYYIFGRRPARGGN